ncbi:MAG: DUF4160 domain-containing protein [Gammaproteobacteria bacterium]
MPTVVEEGEFRIKVFGPPREHPPIHVHVEHGADGLVIIRLATRLKPHEVWAVYDMKNRDVVAAYRLVETHEAAIRAAWRTMHG